MWRQTYDLPTSTPTAHALERAYYAIAVGDMALRFIWALSVFGGVPGRAGMLFFEVVEIFRRTVWAIFRIEWEVVTKVVTWKHDAATHS